MPPAIRKEIFSSDIWPYVGNCLLKRYKHMAIHHQQHLHHQTEDVRNLESQPLSLEF